MNNINLLEVSNIYRTNISRRRIYRKNKRIKQSLEEQANSICKDMLSERYIHNAFGKFTDGYAYYNRDDSILLGFCLWQKKLNKAIPYIHILLLCSQNPEYSLGKTILNDIEYYCFENGIKMISVEPATEELFGYYSKVGGFEIDENNPEQMIKYLHLLPINYKRKNKTRKMTMKKSYAPVIASIMPIDMNTWKNNMY